MEEYEMRIPYRVLKWIENFFLVLFPLFGVISLITGSLVSHTIFYAAALFSISYGTIACICIKKYVKFRHSFVLHGASLLVVSSLYLIGFDYYALGGGLLSITGLLCMIVGACTGFSDRAYRIHTPTINGQAHIIV